MSEQLLDDAYVGPAVQQVGCVRVTQRMRGDLLRDPSPLRGPTQYRPGALAGQAAAAGVQEQRMVPTSARHQLRATPDLVRRQCIAGVRPDGYYALFAAL